ncbi:cytochrome P450 family protein [Microbacterium mangrovi]|uniref:cytochrome P450 n=1 Tax=Microbacterium mangrovi TaxID=1348253 RepID=UPI00068CBE83|nr:cytochrome P450 [Microbacterium mangrovi]
MTDMVPRCPGDSSIAFLSEGYLFGRRRFDRWNSDVFACRLGGRRTIVLRGQDAARWFYEEPRLSRVGAMPTSVVHSLQDEGSVQALSGAEHRARKSLFLRTFGHEGRLSLAERFSQHWDQAAEAWNQGSIMLLDEVSAVLTRATLDWLGIAVTPDQEAERTRELQAMIDGAGSFGPRNWRGRTLRRRTEAWAAAVIEQRRALGAASNGAPIDVIAGWEDAPGQPLPVDVAAVELLNALRPVVAIARFVVFAALALARWPEWRARVLTEPSARAAFAAEVRRSAPFFPVVAGRPTEVLNWNGVRFTPRERVLLDLFATNRHPGEWPDADRFDPARFIGGDSARRIVAQGGGDSARRIVAQGAGDMVDGHRCPGEPSTETILELAVTKLASGDWLFVEGMPSVDLRRIPADPGVRPVRVHWKG